MGDLYEIFLNGKYLGGVIACSEEEAHEEAVKRYGEGEYVAKLVKVERVVQPRSGVRGKAW